MFVDYFLYQVQRGEKINKEIYEKESIEKKNKPSKFDHEEIKEYLTEIGTALGFETETEQKVAFGAVVDVIWKARIANLGVVMYVFEVQSSGSIDSLILNLQKAKNVQSVQKLIVVSDTLQLDRVKREIESIPGDIQKNFSFWDVSDVESTYQRLSEVVKSIQRLNLFKDEFQTEGVLISPDKPFTNQISFIEILGNLGDSINWFDKYFSIKGLELLSNSLEDSHIKEVKIITSLSSANQSFKKLFRDFKEEMESKGINCQLRVIVDKKEASLVHDRFLIGKNSAFNVPSTDVLARGQLSEISKSKNKEELLKNFQRLWKNAKDIVTEWDEIQKIRDTSKEN